MKKCETKKNLDNLFKIIMIKLYYYTLAHHGVDHVKN